MFYPQKVGSHIQIVSMTYSSEKSGVHFICLFYQKTKLGPLLVVTWHKEGTSQT